MIEVTPHAITRARERQGIDLDIDQFRGWNDQCRLGTARLIQVYPATGWHLREVRHEGRVVPVVWDPKARDGRGNVVTVLGGYRLVGEPLRTKQEWRREARRRNRYRWSQARWVGF